MSDFTGHAGILAFRAGEPVFAQALNHNFATLFGLAQSALMAAQHTPEDAHAAFREVQKMHAELERMRAHIMQRQRLRNEQTYAPLSVVGELQKQLTALANPIHQRLDRLETDAMQSELLHDDETTRLRRLETRPERPEAPTMQQHKELQQALEAARKEAREASEHLMQLRADLLGLKQRLDRAEQRRR